ncbi:transcriptional regulator, MarR family [Clostridium sp. USBA 49]|uniref:MarR family winged helix-turn-helix transcriptional regulator n=1 Tax=Clostridium sp. USBA 49 TaxID=1881060 RepID=UPI000999C9B8|nr:MarR family transcriptional regulator [Clostridium sp. USBA 49]SKA74943.1 transcriptional regulator, MarR family [Clostridium sp. USBA 49]
MNDYNRDSLYHIFAEIIKLHFARSHNLLEKLGIYPGQPPLLFALYCKDGQSQRELAEKLIIRPATMTVMLKRMEKSELIIRKQDDKDQRILRVYLTKKGRETCEKLKSTMKVLTEECFCNLTEDEKILLRRLLMQIRDNLIKANKRN